LIVHAYNTAPVVADTWRRSNEYVLTWLSSSQLVKRNKWMFLIVGNFPYRTLTGWGGCMASSKRSFLMMFHLH